MAWKTGARVRFDGDAVFRSKRIHVEGRQKCGCRGATCLVSADLQAVASGPQMIGIVNHPGREPEDLLFDFAQHVQALRRQNCVAVGIDEPLRR